MHPRLQVSQWEGKWEGSLMKSVHIWANDRRHDSTKVCWEELFYQHMRSVRKVLWIFFEWTDMDTGYKSYVVELRGIKYIIPLKLLWVWVYTPILIRELLGLRNCKGGCSSLWSHSACLGLTFKQASFGCSKCMVGMYMDIPTVVPQLLQTS